MLARAQLTVGRDDVIANLGKGYHLADRLLIERHDVEASPNTAASPMREPERSPAMSVKHEPSGQKPLSDRQHWILDQLRQGVPLTRSMVENQFHIKYKQAKRELTGLSNRGMIEFIRKPKPGYYVLLSKPRRPNKPQ